MILINLFQRLSGQKMYLLFKSNTFELIQAKLAEKYIHHTKELEKYLSRINYFKNKIVSFISSYKYGKYTIGYGQVQVQKGGLGKRQTCVS